MSVDQLSFDAYARHSDPGTSRLAATQFSRLSIRAALLLKYRESVRGLTDEEAGTLVGRPGAWKRCAELRQKGLIKPNGETRTSTLGSQQRVCQITSEGLHLCEQLR